MKIVHDIQLTKHEGFVDEQIVRVWRISRIWWIIFLFPLVFLFPYVNSSGILIVMLNLFMLWLASYLIRERWRLTLTNKQIVARKLYPRPFTFLSRVYHFPLSKIEGLTIGPRAFRTILLVGIFISTNVGVTLLKAGLSTDIGYDLPDTIEAIFLLLRGITFLPFLGDFANYLEEAFIAVYELTDEFLIILGIVMIALGVFTVLITLPRRFHMQIRIRNGPDFKLSAGVPRDFWEKCYHELYDNKVVEAPVEYRKWRFPWFEGEHVENSTDLEEIVYLNRFLGIFAIYIGATRLWQRISLGNIREDVLLWVIVALTDIFIAVVAVIFSKKKNEMVVTNKRIIFAREMQDLSGAFGKRLYQLSDIEREDVAGFKIIKRRGISYRYLILAAIILTITIIFWNDMYGTTVFGTIFIRGIFVLLVLILSSFIIQTYLEFNLQTKGGEVWNMRHQLSNPLTMMRQLVGNDENILFTTILSNRLEEREIIDAIQIIRATDLQMQPKLSEQSKYFGNEFTKNIKKSNQLTLESLLLDKEGIKFETNVSRTVPRRKLNLSIASIVMLIFSSSMFLPLIIVAEGDIYSQVVLPILLLIPFITIVLMLVALWVKYYSLYRAKILFSESRAFFIDVKTPPTLLYLLGIMEELHLSETLQSQIHSTYSSRQWSQQQYWRDFIYHGLRFIIYLIVFGLSFAILLSFWIENPENLTNLPLLENTLPLIIVLILIFSTGMVWHSGHLYITFVRTLPKRVVHTQGIGSHFVVPFANKENADRISQTVWEGIITE